MIDEISNLHNEAMTYAEDGLVERYNTNFSSSKHLYSLAYQKEKEAAILSYLAECGSLSMSVLFRSAATLAMECENRHEAKILIKFALKIEDAPIDIKNELEGLLKIININN